MIGVSSNIISTRLYTVPFIHQSVDPDAAAFLTATGISDTTISNAIHTLAISWKNAGLWYKTDIIYPMVGGTAATVVVNLRNTATFQGVINGTVTVTANGAQGNGTTGYINTGYNPITSSSPAGIGGNACFYSRTDVDSAAADIGGGFASNNGVTVGGRNTGSIVGKWGTGNNTTGAVANSLGFYGVNRNSSTEQIYKGATLIASLDLAGMTTGASVYLLAANTNGVAGNFSTRQCAFFSIGGQEFTSQNWTDANSIVNTFQTTLGRNV